jgi:hypothetical protein
MGVEHSFNMTETISQKSLRKPAHHDTLGRIYGRNWDKSRKSFPPFYSVTHYSERILRPPEQNWFETGV